MTWITSRGWHPPQMLPRIRDNASRHVPKRKLKFTKRPDQIHAPWRHMSKAAG